MSDNTLQVAIDLAATGTDQATAASAAVKGVADESLRYQQVLEQMAAKDAGAAQDKRWADLTAQAQAYVPIARAAAEAEKVRAEAAKKLEEQLKQLGQGQKEVGEKTEEGSSHARAQFLLLSEMNKVVPELGHMLHAAFAGPIGPLIILTAAIGSAYDSVKEFNKTLDEAATRGANADFLGSLIDRMGEFASAAADAQGFADSLAHIATNADTLNGKLTENLRLMQAIERALAAQTSAQKALDIAKIQEDEAAHRLTPEQAAQKRADLEKKYIQQEQHDHEQSQDAEMAAKADTLKKTQQNQAKLEADAQAAQAKVEAEKQHSALVKIDPAEQLKKIKEAQDHLRVLDEAQSRVDAGKGSAADYGTIAAAPVARERINAYIAKLEAQLSQYNADVAAAPQRKADEDAAADAKKKAEENKTEIINLTKELEELRKVIAATRSIEESTAGTRAATVDTQERTRITQDFERDFKTLEEFKRAKNPSAVLLERVRAAIADMLAILHDHTDIISALPDHAAAIADLQRATATIQAQLGGNRNTGTSG